MHTTTTSLTSLVLGLLLYFAPPPPSCIAQNAVPDFWLAHAIRGALSLPHGANIPPGALLDLEKLHVPSGRWEEDDDSRDFYARPVRSLDGLEHATNLTSLRLYGVRDTRSQRDTRHELTDASPIAGSTSLETVLLPDAIDRSSPQHARSIASTVATLPSLANLDLSNNALDDPAVGFLASATGLETLNLRDNDIVDIAPLTNLSKLHSLNVHSNAITAVPPLAPLARLVTFDASENSIGDISNLLALPLIERLDLHGNLITDISGISRLRSLQTLNLNDNRIAGNPGSLVLPSLQTLRLDSNLITSFPDITSLPALRILSLANNQIATVSDISGLPELQELDLRNNQITHLSNISDLPGLTSFLITGNRLSHVSDIRNLPLLDELDLSDNQISHLSGFTDLPLLNNLDLSGNQIIDFSGIGDLPALQTLDLTNNRITEITDVPELPLLTTISLADNQLTDVSGLANLPTLRTLDLPNNPPLPRNLAGLQRLTNLSFSPPSGGIPINSIPPIGNLTRLGNVTVDTDLGPAARFPRVANIGFAEGSKLYDLTPLANLPNIDSLSGSFTTNSRRPSTLRPGFALRLETDYDRSESVPDGKLREKSRSLLLLSIDGLLSIKGIGEFSSLIDLTATDGWITDVSPLASTPPNHLDLSNNFISDVSPLAGHTFGKLVLTGNPIDFDTVPEAWKTDPNISLPGFPPLEPAVTIPDPGLRDAIRQAIGARPDDLIDAAALQNLVWLYAENLDIRSLDGLDLATNLRGAALRNNIIKDLTPLASLPSLQWLRVSGNPLSATASQTVGSLRASGTRVDTNEAGRFLSAITPVDGVVYASGYQLSSVRYLDRFTALSEVFLSDNYLSDIAPLTSLTGLRRVHLDGNLLSPDRDPVARASLDSLLASNAGLTVDPQRPEAQDGDIVIPDPALRWLIAPQVRSDKPYDPLAYSIAELESVTTLDWEAVYGPASPIGEITGIESMTNLTYLDLEGAGISDISFLSALTKLQRLDLDRNRITDLSPLAGLTALVELDVNDNLVTSVEPLAGLTELVLLDLDENNIADITPLATLTKLRVLDVHENRITDISTLAGLSALEELDLVDNRVADITPLAGLPLTFLDIRLNQLDLTSDDTSTTVQSLRSKLPEEEFLYLAQFRPELSVTKEGNQLVISFTGDPGVKYRLRKAEPARDDFSTVRSFTVPMGGPRQPIEFRVIMENPSDIYRIRYE